MGKVDIMEKLDIGKGWWVDINIGKNRNFTVHISTGKWKLAWEKGA
jgi:hypothetical protein